MIRIHHRRAMVVTDSHVQSVKYVTALNNILTLSYNLNCDKTKHSILFDPVCKSSFLLTLQTLLALNQRRVAVDSGFILFEDVFHSQFT